MIFPTDSVRIVVATKPVDFRKGHDGLAALVMNEFKQNPFKGTVFVFRAKRSDRLKILYWDGSGLIMTYKRLEDHVFAWPAITDGLMKLNHAQFEALFAPYRRWQTSPAGQRDLDWRKVQTISTRVPAAAE